jgi:hypothetical protein
MSAVPARAEAGILAERVIVGHAMLQEYYIAALDRIDVQVPVHASRLGSSAARFARCSLQ